MAAKDDVGRDGEDVAARFLAAQGWTILGRNWRCHQGEIDIVALDGDDVVIVEVKTRTSATFGTPAEAVTREKLARLRRLAAAWLAQEDRGFAGVRVDVVAIEMSRSGPPRIEHLRGVT